MKKIIALITAICLVLSLAGCSKTNSETSSPISEDTAKEKATAHTQLFLDGKYDEITKDFDAKVGASVKAEQLKSAWEGTVQSAGAYIGIDSTTATTTDGTVSVVVVLKYEKTGVALTLSYDAQGKINGLWLKPVTLETKLEENDKFVESEVKIGQYQLTGILTLPKNTTDYPVAVLLQGSGSSDYDETIGAAANKPFREIAHALAEKGIASVRYSKRYYEKPQLATANVTIYDEYMDDIAQAIKWAAQNVNDDVFVIGHSLGAMSAPKIAADNDEVDGIVMLAGTTRGLEDIIYDQNMQTIDEMDTTQAQKDVLIKQVKDGYAAVKALTKDDSSAPFGISAAYWLSLKTLDGENLLKNTLDIPVLIMQGKADFQVSYEKDFLAMKSALSNKSNITFKEYDNLNHLFMPMTLSGKMDVAEYDAENHIPAQVTDDICSWILANE